MRDKTYKVYLGEYGGSLEEFYRNAGYTITTTLGDSDFLGLAGGVDIDPSTYYEDPLNLLPVVDPLRDSTEVDLVRTAVATGKPIVGICRGAQMLCIMAGGSLYQHVNGHTSSHSATVLATGQSMTVTSTHHQMMYLGGTDGEILMGCAPRSANYYKSMEVDPPSLDPEVVYFKGINGLASQPHPEYMQSNSEYYRYFFNQVELLISGGLS